MTEGYRNRGEKGTLREKKKKNSSSDSGSSMSGNREVHFQHFAYTLFVKAIIN